MKKIKYCCSVLENVKSRHYLASALLNYLDSPDYLLACSAMRNLLILTGTGVEEAVLRIRCL